MKKKREKMEFLSVGIANGEVVFAPNPLGAIYKPLGTSHA